MAAWSAQKENVPGIFVRLHQSSNGTFRLPCGIFLRRTPANYSAPLMMPLVLIRFSAHGQHKRSISFPSLRHKSRGTTPPSSSAIGSSRMVSKNLRQYAHRSSRSRQRTSGIPLKSMFKSAFIRSIPSGTVRARHHFQT